MRAQPIARPRCPRWRRRCCAGLAPATRSARLSATGSSAVGTSTARSASRTPRARSSRPGSRARTRCPRSPRSSRSCAPLCPREDGPAHHGAGPRAVPREPVRRTRRDRVAFLCRLPWDLRPRQRRRTRRGALRGARRVPLDHRAKRAGDGAHRVRLRAHARPARDVRVQEPAALARAVALLRAARRPLIVAGGGAIYSGATDALRRFVDASGIPVAETQAGKGSLPYDHPLSLGAIGATGTLAANRSARDADLVIGIGTRWTDFTTASKTAFARPEVRFVNVNVAEADAGKHSAVAIVADARLAIEALAAAGTRVGDAYRAEATRLHDEWDREGDRLYALGHAPLPAQSEVIGAVNAVTGQRDVVVGAAGSLAGDMPYLR